MKNHGFRFLVIAVITALCLWLTLHDRQVEQKRPDGTTELVKSDNIRLGLDLAGGSSITYSVRGGEITREKLEKAIDVINKRINATGLTEIFVASTAANEIVIEMPKRTRGEIESIKSLIEQNGQLEFRIQADSQREAQERTRREQTPPEIYAKLLKDARWVPWDPSDDRPMAKEILVLTPEGPAEGRWRDLLAAKGPQDPETIRAQQEYEDLAKGEVFRGEDLADTHLTTQGAELVVAFSFKPERRNDFESFTTRNVKKQMAIILDGKVTSAPVINSPLPGGGIIEGGGTGFTLDEANELRIVLESGSTGVQLQLEREETLGASLGEVAIQRGKLSVLVGFAAVFALMLWYYRVPGIVANVALSLNVLITLGALAFFRGALSLPGIAGIVLGLGMSIDANVLIFERLRDERKRGKTLAESLAAGYDNAMSAIIDGNITALLSAFVLIVLGTGAVRGFGVTLAIGLLASMFTAVWVTRCIFDFAVDKGWLRTFEIGKDPYEPKLDYMGGRRRFIIPSLVCMVAGVIAFLVREDDKAKDLEFIGGQQVIVQLDRAMSADEITQIAKGPDQRWEDATAVLLEPQGVEAAPRTSNRWQLRAKATSEEKGKEWVAHLRTALGDRLVDAGFADWKETVAPGAERARATFVLHTLAPVSDPEKLRQALQAQELGNVVVTKPEGAAATTLLVEADVEPKSELAARDAVRRALGSLEPAVHLSDPLPSISFLSPAQAERQWRMALQAVLLSLVFQIIYIRVRFSDYTHGFSAAITLVHDVTVTLGAVALFDALGLVYAKVNLVLIAAFMTLIGYSMNDTIVIFDRIRENLGRSKVVRSRIVNDSINQTLSRSLRTAIIVFATVLAQFVFNRNLGSPIEGFAWVMIVGSIAGSYSSIFIAAPLLLFLPAYTKRLLAKRLAFWGMCVAAVVGAIMAVTAKGDPARLWIGVALASLIPVHFLAHFIPWLGHADPDSLVVEEAVASEEPPLVTPGV